MKFPDFFKGTLFVFYSINKKTGSSDNYIYFRRALVSSLFGTVDNQPKKRVLIVWGGGEGHEPKKCVDIFAPWMVGQGFGVEISDTADAYLDLEKLKKLDVIIQVYTHGTITPQQERNLLEAVKSGV